jgi:hypothetical protein
VAYEEVGKIPEDAQYASYDSDRAKQDINRNVNIREGSSFINKDTNTVAGQLQSLLSSDSPYIQESRRQATEQAGSRGLLNSSIAAGAGQRAAIQSALPIAQQDAQTYTQFGLKEQEARNSMETIQGEAIVSGEIAKQAKSMEQTNQNINNKFTALLRGADRQTEVWLRDFQQTFDKGMQDIRNTHEITMEGIRNTHESDKIDKETIQRNTEMAMTISSGYISSYQVSVENLLSDPDFLAMGGPAVNKAVAELQTVARNGVLFTGAAFGVDLSSFVDDFFSPLEFDIPEGEGDD